MCGTGFAEMCMEHASGDDAGIFKQSVFKSGKTVQNSFAVKKNPSQKRVGDKSKAVPERHGLSCFRPAGDGSAPIMHRPA